ncbi:polysaccharide biosynthesis tyrosine autokinase [Roseovarius nubinhibens]|uniref:polysaccharide biosynthesis tyrosine autokinase n=1 Tax=Roseovarius nubinhibens TaxID=314263 RepID=UPI001C0900CE|nr:polysaccharide biosynthesis tyrosine autokinase [Roseovarius nubinhibens]MBU2999411.1 polysaccharide biosynthesis tyrosine autokinase [Roseovarius nubinhibens]
MADISQSESSRNLLSRGAEEIDLGQLLGTLWRGKLWIAMAMAVALLLGGYYAFVSAVPTYTSSATVALESRQDQVVDIESVVTGLGGDQSTINTEVEVLRSRGLLEQVVERLDLTNDPEFNAALRERSMFSLGALLSVLRSGSDEEVAERRVLDSVIDVLSDKVAISNIRNSYVFRITVTTEAPRKSALIANTVAEAYIRDQISVKFEKTAQATEWLSDQVSTLRLDLENAETELKSFSSSTDLISPEGLFALNRQLKDLRDRKSNLTEAIAAQKAAVVNLETVEGLSPEEKAQRANDPSLARLAEDIQNGVEGAAESFETQYAVLLTRAQQEVLRLEAQFEAVDTSIVELTERIETQSSELVRLQQLEREAQANGLIYEAFLSRLKETTVQQGIQQADSRILSQAVVPLSPSAPKKSMILALSLILGAMVGGAAVLIREMSQNTYRVAEALERNTGLTVIGQIPTIPSRNRANVLQYLTDKPNSAAAEAVRNLRTSLLLANIDMPPRVIMSTSSIPGEGKTTQSISLAQNLSGLGKKVLLVEGDIRRRVFSEYFDIHDKPGFLSVLAGEASLQSAVTFNEQLQADILLGETSKVNAADLFSSDTFAQFLGTLRDAYDYVIIDTPPVLAVPDARVIGQHVDAILYTVKWDSTTHRQVNDGLKSLANVNLKVTGLVLSQIDQRGMKRYGYGDSYGAYQAYYSD